ncbi:hypothetical protein D3C75_723190 [compost metagenome]
MIIRHPYPIAQEGKAASVTGVGKLTEMLGFSLLVADHGVAVGDRPGQALRDTVGKDLCLPVSQVHQFVLLAIRRRGDALLDITGVRCVITVARLELVAVAVGVALADDLGLLAIDDGSDILTEVIADFDQLGAALIGPVDSLLTIPRSRVSIVVVAIVADVVIHVSVGGVRVLAFQLLTGTERLLQATHHLLSQGRRLGIPRRDVVLVQLLLRDVVVIDHPIYRLIQ